MGFVKEISNNIGSSNMKKVAIILWLSALLALLAGVSYAIAYDWEGFRQFPGYLASVPSSNWLAVIFAMLTFHAMDLLCLYSILLMLGARLKFSTGIKALAAGRFASMLTPGKELHIPAEAVMISKQNVALPTAAAAASTKTLFHLMWVCISGAIAL